MTELMRRRGSLMAKNGGESDVVYELKNRAVAMGDVIDTGVVFWDEDFNGTILLDIYIATNHKDLQIDRAYRLISIESNSEGDRMYVGKTGRNETKLSVVLDSAAYKVAISDSVGPGRFKIALTHPAASNSVTCYCQKDGGSILEATTSRTFSASSRNLTLGADETYLKLPEGEIYLAQVYNRILSNGEINAFFA